MPRMARLVVPGYPYHVTQPGNRRQNTFFCPGDYLGYLRLLADARADAGIDIWAYCLMPNHVHLIVVPTRCESLVAFFGEAHRRYTRQINLREGWRGHLWQERFHSSVMDETHLLAAVRYTELNPVRAGLCRRPDDWSWSSIHAHKKRTDDMLVTVKPMLDRVGSWARYLRTQANPCELDAIRVHTRTGRPLGENSFVAHLEDLTGRCLQKGKPGRRPYK